MARSKQLGREKLGHAGRVPTAAIRMKKPPTKSSGDIEAADDGILKGWVLLSNGEGLDIHADGEFVGNTLATHSRPDILNASAFEFRLPPALVDGTEHKFEIRPTERKRLFKHPLVRTVSVPLFANKPPKAAGWIDGIREGLLYGWYSAPTGTRLIVSANDHFFGTTRNNIPRDDVIAAGLSNEPVGFEIEIPEALKDGLEHVFEVRKASADICAESLTRTLLVENNFISESFAKRKTRAAVVCWDLCHNPAGRALVLVQALERLYDEVYLIGPLFQRYGGKVWEPIANNPRIHIIARRVKNFLELEAFQNDIRKQKYDFVYMCKPRWPTLYLGISLAQASECKFALDIDDYELSFFKTPDISPSLVGVIEKLRRDQVSPVDLEATLLAHSVLEHFPSVTVSNVALQHKFGGTIIRHARDESEFDPAAFNRNQIRHSYGYGKNDNVILFLGTIRRHKGVLRIAEAIAQLNRPNLKLCLIGPIGEPLLETEIRKLLGSRVCFHNGIPFTALAATTLLADLVCLPQEMDSEVSQYQIPAKLTDALSMGIPVIVEHLPPFRDLEDVPGVYVRKHSSLAKLILKALKERHSQKQGIRDFFLSEFSTAASAKSLARLIGATPVTDSRKWSQVSQTIGIRTSLTAVAVNHSASVICRSRGRDIVFLWKQNDSGLFGRRSDMVLKHLVQQGFAGRVLQFDASISLDRVNRLRERADQIALSADGMVYRNIVSRYLGLSHDLQVSRFTIVHDNKQRSFLGNPLPAESDIPDVLRSIFKAERLSEEAILWICPVAFDLDWVTKARRFAFNVVDLIDDQRSFSTNEDFKNKLGEQYALAMAAADIVFANCDGVARRFCNLTKKPIHVVSNAADRISPHDIQAIDIFAGRTDVFRIGYVGSLRDRIDIALLIKIAEANSSWQLILVGPTDGKAAIEDLGRYSNITLLGPQRYEDSIRIASSFDVAIIPHTLGELTASMNPLKMYMYQMLGLPVVSTEVENMTGANDLVHKARDHKDFLARLRRISLKPGRHARAQDRRGDNVYWDDNVAAMIRIANETLAQSKSKSLQ